MSHSPWPRSIHLLRARVLTVIPTLSRSETMCCSIDLNVASPSRIMKSSSILIETFMASRSHCCVCCEDKKEENGLEDQGNISDLGSLAHIYRPQFLYGAIYPCFLCGVCVFYGVCRACAGACARVPGRFSACAEIQKKLCRDLKNIKVNHKLGIHVIQLAVSLWVFSSHSVNSF